MEYEFTLDVSGLSTELRPVAEKDIKWLASLVAGCAKKMDLQFLLKEIRITNQFEKDVNDLLHGKSGLSAFAARRDNVQAYGKLIRINCPQDGLGFVVLIDAEMVGKWSLDNPWCLVATLHELGHVLFEARALRMLGDESYPMTAETKERLLVNLAKSLIEEYDVDRLVDEIIRIVCKKEDGKPWTLREMEEAKGVDWVGGLMSGLYEFPQTIDDAVIGYKNGRISLDELFVKVVSNAKDLLILLTHTAAILVDTASWPDIIGRISRTEAYRRFLGEHIEAILDALGNSTIRFETTLQSAADAIEEILECCGLKFRNVAEGVYISVGWPNS